MGRAEAAVTWVLSGAISTSAVIAKFSSDYGLLAAILPPVLIGKSRAPPEPLDHDIELEPRRLDDHDRRQPLAA